MANNPTVKRGIVKGPKKGRKTPSSGVGLAPSGARDAALGSGAPTAPKKGRLRGAKRARRANTPANNRVISQTDKDSAAYTDEDYAVYMDANRHTCIFVRHARRRVEFIPMDSAGLEVKRWHADRFYQEFSTKAEAYPIRKAAERYMEAGKRIGCNDAAEAHLQYILNDYEKGAAMETAGATTVVTAKVVTPKPTATKKAPTAAKVAAGKKLAAKAKEARKGNADDSKKIKLLVKENPKREGSAAYKKYELYRKYTKVADLLEHGKNVGYRRSTLRYDLKHKFIAFA